MFILNSRVLGQFYDAALQAGWNREGLIRSAIVFILGFLAACYLFLKNIKKPEEGQTLAKRVFAVL